MILQALDTIHVSSVSSENITTGQTFEVDDQAGRSLIERGLAIEVDAAVAAKTEFACVWAEVKDILLSRAERMANQIQIARRPARIRIRYLAGITPDMRVIIAGRVYQIIAGPSMLGRREAIELMVEEHSSEGTAP